MAYTQCTVATDNISNLDDLPNDVGGLTAAQLKYMFDKFGDEFVTWFNATHLNELYTIAQKNYIIDGGFQVAQANPVVGTEISNPSGGTYPVCDLWKLGSNQLSGTFPTTIKHNQQVDSGETFYRINPNGAGSGEFRYQLTQNIENGTRKLCGASKKVTVSFEAKSDISNKRLGVCLYQNYGTGGSPSSQETLNGTNITLTSSWVKYSYTFTTNTLSAKTFGTNTDDSLIVVLTCAWDTATDTYYGASTAETFVGSGNIDIRRVKLEAGDTATPFEQEPFGEVLQKCMRYYIRFRGQYFRTVTSSLTNTTTTQIFHPLPVSMRIAPTISIIGTRGTDWALQTLDGTTNTTGTFGNIACSNKNASFQFSSGTYANKDPLNINLITASGFIDADARF